MVKSFGIVAPDTNPTTFAVRLGVSVAVPTVTITVSPGPIAIPPTAGTTTTVGAVADAATAIAGTKAPVMVTGVPLLTVNVAAVPDAPTDPVRLVLITYISCIWHPTFVEGHVIVKIDPLPVLGVPEKVTESSFAVFASIVV